MPHPISAPDSESRTSQLLRHARQRIVELATVRAYLQDLGRLDPSLQQLNLMIEQALALEESLMRLGKKARPR